MPNDVTAQAFREAAAKADHPDELWAKILFLTAAEQREQLDAWIEDRQEGDAYEATLKQQIATLTAERDALSATLESLTETDAHAAVDAARTVLQHLRTVTAERDEARTLLADFKLHLT